MIGVNMVKRIHFCENNEVLCNQLGPKAQYYHYKKPIANNDYKRGRRLKTTTDTSKVTCEHCKEKISSRSRTFLCATCGKTTDTFLITETVIVHSSITAKERGRRTHMRTEKRKLISITCPICNTTTLTTDTWRTISCDMKIEGLQTERVRTETLVQDAEAQKV